MENETKITPKFSYQEFVAYMQRYEREKKKRESKAKSTNPYKYKKVFQKDK